ncbi:MAG: inositol monophosphatase family protein [Kiritimatiellia bacterium]
MEASILQCFPNHAILGEEGSAPDASAEFEWVIDPIDGTLNFFHGLPHWCPSVAVRRGDGPILAGCVFLPDLDECSAAARPARHPQRGAHPGVRHRAALRGHAAHRAGQAAPGEAYDSLLGRLANTAQKTRASSARRRWTSATWPAGGWTPMSTRGSACGTTPGPRSSRARPAAGRGDSGRPSGGRVRYLASNCVIHDEVLKLYLWPTA